MKRAFTMLELVFVIVIIGVLATKISPRFDRDNLQEAANQLTSHIRYTQHLAMIDNKFDQTNQYWYKNRWQLLFSKSVDATTVWSYTIFCDDSNNNGQVNINDTIAKKPDNPTQYLSGGSSGILTLDDERRDKKMALKEFFGIEDVKFSNCGSTAKRVAFDYLGRPISGNLSSDTTSRQDYITNRCEIDLCTTSCTTADLDEKITIAIEPETGYTHIL